MNDIFIEIVKSSPILGVMVIMWYFQRKDYSNLVNRLQSENGKREEKYQETIGNLTKTVGIVQDIKDDVEEIKYKLK